ncbi:hypothetical protein LTR56_013334 [Elasticomyces elasticus]|nr:hypothetical protein LTR22_020161 [Elasticomyces elasticus]KAK3637934.1 hypothetical protein LTR56_013334 [Elasticomyces elasticus]KAK4910701.1 hypothetical protein LTR49_020640 [Elasticomyces elasticus]KAK5751444.1 hypothetical protein LTS12_018455 [Elasticomyces elasticus]
MSNTASKIIDALRFYLSDISGMANRHSTAANFVLVSHVAVDYVHAQGLGIGIVQQVIRESARTPTRSIIKVKKQKYGIKAQYFTPENVKTFRRAHMLGLLHSLGLACSIITDSKSGFNHVGSVRVIFASPAAAATVRLIKHHIENGPESLEDVVSTDDQMMIKRVVAAVRKLAKHVPAASINVAALKDSAAAKAATMARQKVGEYLKLVLHGVNNDAQRVQLSRVPNNERDDDFGLSTSQLDHPVTVPGDLRLTLHEEAEIAPMS